MFEHAHFCPFSLDPLNGGVNRWATIFPYVVAPKVGGQTAFPSARHLSDEDLAKLSPEVIRTFNHTTQTSLYAHKCTCAHARVDLWVF